MTTSKEKNVFYVHYYESDSSGGELPLMRIEAENEDEANLICLRNLADVYDVDHDDISLEDGFEVNGNSVYLQGIYPATSEQALVVDAVFNMTSVEPVAEAVTGTAESACGISLVLIRSGWKAGSTSKTNLLIRWPTSLKMTSLIHASCSTVTRSSMCVNARHLLSQAGISSSA